MTKLSMGALIAVPAITLLTALPAQATVSIQSRIDPGSDHKWIKPFVRIQNDSTTPISLTGMSINYYFYDATASPSNLVTQIFYSSQLPPGVTDSRYDTDLSFTFSQLPSVVTGPNGKFANMVCQVNITGGHKSISTGQFYELQFGFHTPNWYKFYERDDWSYLDNVTTFTSTTNISLTDATGDLVAGLEPVTSLLDLKSDAVSHIKHVIVIMQENRSFDNYFGSYSYDLCPISYCDLSGRTSNHFADGILGGDGLVKPEILDRMPETTFTCTYNGQTTTLSPPNRITDKDTSGNEIMDDDFPHYASSAAAEILPYPRVPDILPFIDQALNGYGGDLSKCPNINQIIGYHSGKNTTDELYQYWQFAANFVLQDHMFEAVKSWSPVSHLYMVSAYSPDPASCTLQGTQEHCPTLDYDHATDWGGSVADDHPWDNIADLLRGTPNKWKFYESNGWDYQCGNCSNTTNPGGTRGVTKCIKRSSAPNGRGTNSGDAIADFWSPLKHFRSVKSHECKDATSCATYVGDLNTFYTDVGKVTSSTDNFPAVSWIVPGQAVSEHGGLANIRPGVAYVTSMIQAIMRNPQLWDTTAIFVSWDDWGGFFDHFAPKKVDEAGWGFRVPGILISKWARYRLIDKLYYSHDAYLRLIEDLFAGSTRISQSGATMCMDGRPSTREEAQFIEDPYGGIGDLLSEFDFDTGDPNVPGSGRKFITPSTDPNSIDAGKTYTALTGMKCCVDPCN